MHSSVPELFCIAPIYYLDELLHMIKQIILIKFQGLTDYNPKSKDISNSEILLCIRKQTHAVRADLKTTMKPLSQARTKHLNCPLKYMQILVSRLSFLQVHRQMIERANILQLGYSILFFFFPQYFGANSTFILFLSHSDSCSHYSCNTEQIWKFIFNPSAPASSTI